MQEDDPTGQGSHLPHRLEVLCRRALPRAGVDGAGVALVTRAGHRATVCATDAVAARLEEAQFVLGEGPCVDASAGRSPVLLDDLLDLSRWTRARWPGFLEAAGEVGVRAVFAFPLRLGTVAFGALDLYRLTPGPLQADELRTALLTADVAALALLELREGKDLLRQAEDGAGEGAMTAFRYQVHGAAGMVKVQLGSTIEHALMHLRAFAFAEDRSIDDIAKDVLEGRLSFTRENP
ncbi:MAG: hypothetical protein JWN17_1769 [Frankiales bacterium]|nr:hypothetical protein [Frankiales bacterium]